MKTKEKPIFLSKAKKIQLIKNISINIKCINAQNIKLKNKISQNVTNQQINSNYITTNNKISNNNSIDNNIKKIINIIDIKKIPNTKKVNKKRSKSTKSLSVNNSNKSNIKHNFLIKINSKKTVNNKSYLKSTNNAIKKNDFYKKININKSISQNKIRKNNNKQISPINCPKKKLIRNNDEINLNNPMEITFGSSSFMSKNLQTETNETDKEKKTIKINNKINKFKKKNNSFIINLKKELKNKRNSNINHIKQNKIVKLNKKLLLKSSWKIKPSIIKKPLNSLYYKDKEKSLDDKKNKSSFLIENYNKKTKYNNNSKKNHFNFNIITDMQKSKSFLKENKIINKNKKLNYQEKKVKSKNKTFYNKNLLRNKIFKMRNETEEKNSSNIIKNYTLNNTSFFERNKIKRNNKDKLDETNEFIIKINKSIDKENGKYKLIIKRTNKVIKRMPKSTPKLLLTHPSFKNLFF